MTQNMFMKLMPKSYLDKWNNLKYLSIDGINGWMLSLVNYNKFIKKNKIWKMKKWKSGRKSKRDNERNNKRRSCRKVAMDSPYLTEFIATWIGNQQKNNRKEKRKNAKENESVREGYSWERPRSLPPITAASWVPDCLSVTKASRIAPIWRNKWSSCATQTSHSPPLTLKPIHLIRSSPLRSDIL